MCAKASLRTMATSQSMMLMIILLLTTVNTQSHVSAVSSTAPRETAEKELPGDEQVKNSMNCRNEQQCNCTDNCRGKADAHTIVCSSTCCCHCHCSEHGEGTQGGENDSYFGWFVNTVNTAATVANAASKIFDVVTKILPINFKTMTDAVNKKAFDAAADTATKTTVKAASLRTLSMQAARTGAQEAAKTTARTGAQEAVKTTARTGAQEAAKTTAKAGVQEAAKTSVKTVAKSAFFVGAAVESAFLAYDITSAYYKMQQDITCLQEDNCFQDGLSDNDKDTHSFKDSNNKCAVPDVKAENGGKCQAAGLKADLVVPNEGNDPEKTKKERMSKQEKHLKDEFKKTVVTRSVASVSSVGGGTAGAVIGSFIFPVVGTIIGGAVGAVVGDYVGSQAGQAVGGAMFDSDEE